MKTAGEKAEGFGTLAALGTVGGFRHELPNR